MLFGLRITKNNEIRLGKLEKHDLLWEPNLYSCRWVACTAISLRSWHFQSFLEFYVISLRIQGTWINYCNGYKHFKRTVQHNVSTNFVAATVTIAFPLMDFNYIIFHSTRRSKLLKMAFKIVVDLVRSRWECYVFFLLLFLCPLSIEGKNGEKCDSRSSFIFL